MVHWTGKEEELMWNLSYCLHSFCQVTREYTTIIELFWYVSSCMHYGYLPVFAVELKGIVVSYSESLPLWIWSLSGRFDFHVQLPAPAATERGAILKHEIQKRSLQCSDDILLDVASKCDGYDAYDLVLSFFQIY